MNWSDLSEKQKTAVRRAYEAGKEPGEIAPTYGLKPKQVSDQAYRKKWKKVAKKSAAKGKGKSKTARKPAARKSAKRGKAKKPTTARKPAKSGKKSNRRR